MLNYLQPDKQYLEYKGIPCRVRAAKITGGSVESATGEGSGEDEWVEASGCMCTLCLFKMSLTVCVFFLLAEKKAEPAPAASSAADDDDDPYLDFDDDTAV